MVWKVEVHDGLRYFLWTCDKETYSVAKCMVEITIYLVQKGQVKKEEV